MCRQARGIYVSGRKRGPGGGMHTIRPSTPMCKLLCEVAVPVDVGLVAKGRDPVDIGMCWCHIPQRARVGEPDNLQVALT